VFRVLDLLVSCRLHRINLCSCSPVSLLPLFPFSPAHLRPCPLSALFRVLSGYVLTFPLFPLYLCPGRSCAGAAVLVLVLVLVLACSMGKESLIQRHHAIHGGGGGGSPG